MRFTYAEAMTQATFYAPLAQAAEAAGYTSMTVADSLIYPKDSDSKYPYTDTGDREFLDGKEFIETMVLCAHLFAVTTTLRLTPFVLKLPVRPPVLVAKQASSLAFLSDNRLGLGVGISPWPEDFDDHGRRLGQARQAHGRVHGHPARADHRRVLRVPRRVLRRRRAQAVPRRRPRRSRCWSAATSTPRCAARCARATAGCTPAATARSSTGCSPGSPRSARRRATPATTSRCTSSRYDAYTVDGIKRLEDKGVTDCIVGFRVPYIKGPDTEPLDKKIEHLERYAEEIISKVNGGEVLRSDAGAQEPRSPRSPRSSLDQGGRPAHRVSRLGPGGPRTSTTGGPR